MLLGLRNDIDINNLLSSRTYKTDFFDKCVYCNKDVENDYYEYKDEWYQPFRCNCEKALEELSEKELFLNKIEELNKSIDYKLINKEHKDILINIIEESFKEGEEVRFDIL